MSAEAIANDFGRKISRSFQEQLQREMALIQPLLPPAEIVMMLAKLASGMSTCAIMAALQLRNETSEMGEFYDLVRVQIDRLNEVAKPEVMEIMTAVEARDSRTPAQTDMLARRGVL